MNPQRRGGGQDQEFHRGNLPAKSYFHGCLFAYQAFYTYFAIKRWWTMD